MVQRENVETAESKLASGAGIASPGNGRNSTGKGARAMRLRASFALSPDRIDADHARSTPGG